MAFEVTPICDICQSRDEVETTEFFDLDGKQRFAELCPGDRDKHLGPLEALTALSRTKRVVPEIPTNRRREVMGAYPNGTERARLREWVEHHGLDYDVGRRGPVPAALWRAFQNDDLAAVPAKYRPDEAAP
jgi:hypothetical protein